ncbi:glycosyltransferase family 2 protein [Sanyastnella coralliicola]|uniref:glycosyltransferase family 2 protein n=1 Tax=Sanyastnella coralliicola TaxID=3069118 RepID=UPI0027B8ABBD|nr:glycosyltransferase family 2 protein [Longitalea sp. SCSIO 12813]
MSWRICSSTRDRRVQKIAVAILNWNGRHYLEKFLPSVVQHSRDHAEVWIIDNGSTDDSLELLRTQFPEVKIHENKKNYGFAQGYNEGLKHIQADIYVLLNSDVEVTANWIPPVVEYMESSDLTACQPKILDYNKKEWFEHAGATGGFIDKYGFVFCAGRIFDGFEKDEGQYDENKEVFWASGASLFIRAEKYHLVGGLDEDFFAHMEEIDLCWRLKNRGYKIGACGKSVVYHVGGGTLDKLNPFKTFLNFRNNLFILVKNYHYGSLFMLIMKRLVLDGIAGMRFLTEGKLSYTLAVLKAHGSFYAHLGGMRKKRKDIRSRITEPNRVGWYESSIIVDYYFKKKAHFTELDRTDFPHS